MIFGVRVKEARDLRGLTQAQLAEQVGVDPSTIAYIEADHIKDPRPEVVDGIAHATGFPVAFFEDGEEIDFPAGSLLFRARLHMLKREEAEARAWGSVIYRRVHPLLARLRVPPITLPRLTGVEPEEAASYTRAALGLSPDRPIPHLINAAERAGVLVLAMPIGMPHRDAYSAWVGDEQLRPVVVIVNGVPGDRQRFSVAHELGHLVMHQPRPSAIKEIEAEAGSFAEALLMPADGIRTDLAPPVTLTRLAMLKPKWGVSIQALVRRARHLELITQRQYTYLFEQIGRRGWRTDEPSNIAIRPERPRAVRKMIEVVYGENPDYLKLGQDMRLFPHQAKQLVEAHADRSELPPRGSIGRAKVIQMRKPSLVE